MRRGVSVCVVGAGSSYTPELIDGILGQTRDALPVAQLRLTDINPDRLGIMAGFAQRAIAHSGREIAVDSDTDLGRMLKGADFVIAQIRVGGMKARHLDESIPLKYGLLGQETTGPGGMCNALRTIPTMVEIARKVEEISPDAFVLNYTNPSGIVTEAVTKYTQARIIGLCAGIPGVQDSLKRRFASRYPDFKTYAVGLNHFGYVYRMVSGDREVTAEVIDLLDQEEKGRGGSDAGMSMYRLLQAVPLSYVGYFLHRSAAVARRKADATTRAQEVEVIESRILEEAARPETVSKPEALKERGGGGYADITFSVMKAIINDTGEELTANVPNRGTVLGIDDDAVVEVVCEVNRHGARALPVGPIPLAFRGLVQALKAYETLTVEAAMHRDRRLATLALMNHPLVGDLDIIGPLLSEMLEANGLVFIP